jgi:hypothetical protein
MAGESPLHMMQPPGHRNGRREAAPRRRLWPVFVPTGLFVALAAGWCVLWYYAAGASDRAIAGWLDREAKAGRVYSCGQQSIGGFPFRIEVRCSEAGADLRSNQPPFSVKTKDVVVVAQVYHPTLLISEITGPLTLSEPGKPPSFIANWKLAQTSLRGVPPEPERISVVLDKPHLEAAVGGNSNPLYLADRSELHVRLIGGSARRNPVIETAVRLVAAAAPNMHPLIAQPLDADFDAVLTGLKDLSPKPWTERLREMQAAGGNVEIKHVRVQRGNIIVVGAGTLKVNEHGRLDGLVRLAIVDIEHLVPLLGIDRAIAQGIGRLTGSTDQAAQGLGGLDRLVPGLSDVVRQSANAAIVENVKKMGEPTEVDKKPAVMLPLNISDGQVYLGMIPLGVVPPLF